MAVHGLMQVIQRGRWSKYDDALTYTGLLNAHGIFSSIIPAWAKKLAQADYKVDASSFPAPPPADQDEIAMDDLGAQGWPVAWSAEEAASGQEADGGFDIRGMSTESGLTEDGQIKWPAWNASMRQSTLALAKSNPAALTLIVRVCLLPCKLLHEYFFYLGSPQWREAMQFDMLGGVLLVCGMANV